MKYICGLPVYLLVFLDIQVLISICHNYEKTVCQIQKQLNTDTQVIKRYVNQF